MPDETDPHGTGAPSTSIFGQGAPPSAPTPPPAAPLVTTQAAKAPVTAADQLRAFEDDHFGKDAPRINGELERGVGSPYSRMTHYQKRHYESLEHLVKAEKKVADATAELETAKAKHVAAVKVSEDAAKAIVEADKAAKIESDKEAARVKAATPPKAA
jgi:hypothetical protein